VFCFQLVRQQQCRWRTTIATIQSPTATLVSTLTTTLPSAGKIIAAIPVGAGYGLFSVF